MDNIGNGALFPIKLGKNSEGQTGWYRVYNDTRLIENNIQSILTYELGFRFRQEYFGNRLNECLEEPNTQKLNFMIQQFIDIAISPYEGRIALKNITTSRINQILDILVEYEILSTGKEGSVLINYNLNQI